MTKYEAICEIVKEQIFATNDPDYMEDTLFEALNIALKTLDETEWISINDRLPSEAGQYLVTYHPCYWDIVQDNIMVGIDTFRGKTEWAKRKRQKVIAWMPLPEPYRDDKETH